MKRKELKQIAKKLAEQEKIIHTSTDEATVKAAQEQIFILCSKVNSLDDIAIVDEMVQEFLTL